MARSIRCVFAHAQTLVCRGASIALIITLATSNVSADTPDGARSGERVFNQSCFACHGTGMNGAPVIGDQYEWQDRLAKGERTLIENTLKGLNNMPPRGACADCSETEIAAAVRYLIKG